MIWFRRSAHPEEGLSAYMDGELSERARRAVETHLTGCETCSSLLAELQDAKSLLRELPKAEPRRSLALGPEFVVERRAPTPRRASFTFAPAGAALVLLLSLLFVDAIDTTGRSQQQDAFNTAASQAEGQPEAAAGLAVESSPAGGEAAAGLGAADSSSDGGAADALAAAPAVSDDSPSGTAGGALAAPSQEPSEPETAATPPQRQALRDDERAPPESEKATTDSTAEGPQESSQLTGSETSSDGPSTLRILQVLAALALAASLMAVLLPRIVARQER